MVANAFANVGAGTCAGLALSIGAKRGAARNGVALSFPAWASVATCVVTTVALRTIAPSLSIVEALVILAAIACAATDAVTGLIFDEISLGTCAFVVLSAAVQGQLAFAAGGVSVVALFFAAVFLAGALACRDLQGGGDVKLMIAAGALLGPAGALGCIAVTYAGAALYIIPSLVVGTVVPSAAVRLGPFIAVAVVAVTLRSHLWSGFA